MLRWIRPLPAILSTSEIGLPQRVLDLRRIAAVDGRADVAQRAAQARAQLAVVLAALDVLPVRFERGFVTGHSRFFLVIPQLRV